MKEIIEIFRELQNTSEKKGKEKIISDNKDNELFKQCLIFLFDNNIQTGIKSKSLQKNIKYDGYIMLLDSWTQCMEYFKKNNTGRDYDILVAQAFIRSQDEEDREFYAGMITKSIKLGCDRKTINKCIPNLIFEWKIQLGSPYEKLKLKKNEKFFISQKMNGIRASIVDGKFMSRQGKEICGLIHIIQDVYKLQLEDYFLDGELIRKNFDNCDDNLNFRMTASIVNSDSEEKKDIEFVIFDMFPTNTINGDKTTEKYSVRKQRMLDLQKHIEELGIKNIRIVKMLYEGTDQTEIHKCLEQSDALGWEGCMVNKDTPYEFKRTTNLIKIKSFKEADCPIIDILEGDGRLKGTLGAFVVRYKNNTVRVGSGFSDEQRKHFWAIRDLLIGRVIAVKYKEVSYDSKTSLPSLQFPIFVKLCDIGKEANFE